ncbi:TadE/TadG family type IV pilus assembly protein [Methylobacterium iners]|uniref:TadE/TadG family type IV pilus assembly protein n=1 Tax=Methylobacterium iners TaxID=418707 RepID=UPI0036200562
MPQKFRSDQSGASAVEFALIAPVFIAILMAVCEFSFVFFTLNTAQHAVWDAARQLAVGRTTPAAAQDAIKNALPQWVGTQATIVADKDPADSTRYLVRASIPIAAATPTNFLAAAFGGNVMTASATLMQETQ